MKPLYAIFLLLVLCTACAEKSIQQPAPIPPPSLPFVIDTADLLTPEQLIKFQDLFIHYEMRTHNKIGLLTIRDYKPEKDLHAYSMKYYKDNHLGEDSSKNNILIVFCSGCHGVQIYSGSSTNDKISSESMQSIVHNVMIPCFRHDRHYEGLFKGSEALIAMLDSVSQN